MQAVPLDIQHRIFYYSGSALSELSLVNSEWKKKINTYFAKFENVSLAEQLQAWAYFVQAARLQKSFQTYIHKREDELIDVMVELKKNKGVGRHQDDNNDSDNDNYSDLDEDEYEPSLKANMDKWIIEVERVAYFLGYNEHHALLLHCRQEVEKYDILNELSPLLEFTFCMAAVDFGKLQAFLDTPPSKDAWEYFGGHTTYAKARALLEGKCTENITQVWKYIREGARMKGNKQLLADYKEAVKTKRDLDMKKIAEVAKILGGF